MRRVLTSLAVLALGFSGAGVARIAWAQEAPGPSAEDKAFYIGVARGLVASAGDYANTTWTGSGGRSGVISFTSAVNGCRDFSLTEYQPTTRPPVLGRLCQAPGISGGAPIYTASNVRYAPAAAGEGGGTRGIGSHGSTRGLSVPPPAPPPPPPPPPPPSAAPTPPPAARPTPPPRPYLINLDRNQPRYSRAGGHAVVLLTTVPSAQGRNRTACEAILANFDTTTYSQGEVGLQREGNQVVAIRPLFWPVNSAAPAGSGDVCARRLAQYDYTRAVSIRSKLQIPAGSSGPFLIVWKSDQSVAEMLDMSGYSTAQVQKGVVYFREHFSGADIWDAQRNTPVARHDGIVRTFGHDFLPSVAAAIGIVAASASASTECGRNRLDTSVCR